MFFSVIIPTYNRLAPLRGCLEALQRQNFSGQAEILVVYDGGRAALESLPRELEGPLPLRILRQSNSGPGSARNAGALAARGSHLIFTDDDCIPWEDFLHDYSLGFRSTPEALLGGKVKTRAQENLFCHASQVVIDLALAFFNPDPNDACFFASNNFAVPRQRFLELGGFRGSDFRIASEDREFCDRWKSQGLQLRALPRAGVYHAPDLDLGSYLRMYFRYGRGASRYHRLRKQRGSGSLRSDSRFHLHLPRSLPAALQGFTAGDRLAIGFLLGLWQLANLAGFLYEGLAGSKTFQED